MNENQVERLIKALEKIASELEQTNNVLYMIKTALHGIRAKQG